MVKVLAVAAAIIASSCATMTDRIVSDAMNGLAYSASYTPTLGGRMDRLAVFDEHLKQLKINVQYVPPGDRILGSAVGVSLRDDVDGNLYIRLRQNLPVNGSIQVLAHEAAHLFQPPHLTRAQGDVFAEIVAAHVADRLGVPHAAQTSALWLRQYKAALRVAADLRNEIDHVVAILTPDKFKPVVVDRPTRPYW